jgi:hypothetical protein
MLLNANELVLYARQDLMIGWAFLAERFRPTAGCLHVLRPKVSGKRMLKSNPSEHGGLDLLYMPTIGPRYDTQLPPSTFSKSL